MSGAEVRPAVSRAATAAETGKYCPYCRFPLKEQARVIECGACESVHHDECWHDNGGCAVMGCVSAPAPPATEQPPPPPRAQEAPAGKHPQPDVFVRQGGAAPAPAASQSSRGVLVTALAVGVAALTVIAIALAVAALQDDGGAPVDATAASADAIETPEEDSDTEDPVEDRGMLPDVPRSQMVSDMKSSLLTFHEDIVAGDFHGAWELMSNRKRRQARNETGYAGWKKNQASLQPYLDPSGLRVRVISLDESSGVATVDATGMTWSQPGASCSEWAGVTWLKYEGDEWTYDPGYSTTAERKRKWKSRFDDLMGGEC